MRLRQRFLTLKPGLGASLQLDSRILTESVGSSVTTWTDLSGNNRNPTQGTSGNRATVTLDAGGQKTLSFNGTQFYEIASSTGTFNNFHNGAEAVAFIVGNPDVTSENPGRAATWFGNHRTASASIGSAAMWEDRFGVGNNAIRMTISNGGGSGLFPAAMIVSDTWSSGSWQVARLVYDADASPVIDRVVAKISGGADIKTNSQTQTRSTSNAAFNMQIGAPGGTFLDNVNLIGKMSAVLLFNNGVNLNASMRKRIEHALAISFKIRCL